MVEVFQVYARGIALLEGLVAHENAKFGRSKKIPNKSYFVCCTEFLFYSRSRYSPFSFFCDGASVSIDILPILQKRGAAIVSNETLKPENPVLLVESSKNINSPL